MQYGIVGTGYSFLAHLATLKLIPACQVTAVCGRDPDRLQAAASLASEGCDRFQSYHDLLRSERVDLVIVATPNDTHFQISRDALNAGKHVLCEKPMTTSLEDAETLLQTAEHSSGRLFVGLELRSNDFFRTFYQLVQTGKIGKPKYFWIREYRGFFQPGSHAWRLSASSGGTFLEKNVHHFDIFNWLSGSTARRVAALGANAFHQEHPAVNDEAMAIIEYDNGCMANLNVCLHAPWNSSSGSHQELGAIGDEGMLEAFLDGRKIVYTPTRGEQEIFNFGENPHQKEYERLQNYRPDYDSWFCYLYPEHEAILAVLEGRPGNVATASEGYESVRLALAAEQSARTGQFVQFQQ